ncbi:MAG: phosphoribosylglycinamide formyltransferase [Candidatus Goldbacteria bacterium]|nr:phosphoribosylglycinamide formyltransferase [Candidatus Goldiibacteriota bacterium]
MVKIAVLVSGGGSNLQSLIDAVESGYIKNGKIELVISNKADAFGLKRAEKHGIKSLFVNPKEFKSPQEYDAHLAKTLNASGINLVCLAGYMKILTKEFIDGFNNPIMNIHPALLPSFGGKGCYGLHVHEKVLEYGAKVTGCTVHFVDYGADTGPIIMQEAVSVSADDTPETLQKKVLVYEHKLYKEAVKLFCEGKIKLEGRIVKISGEN